MSVADATTPPPLPAGAPPPLPTGFAGRRGPLFWLALRTSLFTVATLGLYRFWMKTRLRRWYWSAVHPGGTPLEYVGEPLEKLLGFLIAVVFLAFYIGIVNLILMFASFALFQANVGAYALSFIGIVPIFFYARYRARRYILARSRWRGIRFGLRPGAWGYAWRALLHWAATILTLGLWWPRMTFALEAYRTDRTTFGNVTLAQGGSARMLYRAIRPLLAAALLSALFAALSWFGGNPAVSALLVVLVPLMLYGLVHYRVESFRLLANAKTAGPLGLVARPRVGRVVGIYLGGGALVLLSTGFVLVAFGTVLGLLTGVLMNAGEGIAGAVLGAGDVAPMILTAIGIAAYFVIFLSFGVFRHVFITLPVWRHYAETLTVTGTGALPRIRQAGRDEFAEAEGFAEALDVGAAI